LVIILVRGIYSKDKTSFLIVKHIGHFWQQVGQSRLCLISLFGTHTQSNFNSMWSSSWGFITMGEWLAFLSLVQRCHFWVSPILRPL
jgi:hypothetical protein